MNVMIWIWGNGKYKTFSGYVAPYTDMASDHTAKLEIFADDTLVYSVGEISRTTERFRFDIDVTGVKFLKIVDSPNSTYWDSGYGLIFSDLVLSTK